MQVERFLEDAAQRFPDKTALVCGERRLRYAELEQESNRLAHGLLELGVRRGDRVAVCLENSVETVVSIFAVWKAGATLMMVNPTTKSEKLAHVLNDSEAAALVAAGRKLESVADSLAQSPHLRVLVAAGEAPGQLLPGGAKLASFDELLAAGGPRDLPPAKRCIDLDLASLLYTSGSTGTPKGVMLTHLNFVSVTRSIVDSLENCPEDVILDVLPLSFGYGLTQVLTATCVGATLVLERSFVYPQATLQRMVAERVTGFAMVPTIAAILLQHDLSKHDLRSLRYLTNAGAAIPTEFLVRLRAQLPQVKLIPMYGQTECIRISSLPPDQVDVRPDSVGKGMTNQELTLVNEHGQPVAPGETGELVVRGAHVMRGYWKLPEETERKLRPGPFPGEKVLHTGDLFRRDAEGWLYFVSRTDDIIKTRGEKVSPREVENVLYALPGVAEAVVYGVNDPVLGQAVKAVVALKPGAELGERTIRRHCADHLEDFMVPKHVGFVAEIPKTANGKLDKQALQAATEGQH